MTYYHEQVKKISGEIYPKEYLCQQVVKAKLFIDKNFANNINLNAIAGEAFYSKFHFIRLFKTMYGRTPHQYLASLRIRKAKQYLQKGMSVTQACLSVGFSSLSSFNKLFKKSTGSLPSSYKKI